MVTSMDDIKDNKFDRDFDKIADIEVIPEMNQTPIDAELDIATQELAEASNVFEEDFLYHLKPDSRRNERIIAFCLIYAADRFDYTVSLDVLMQNLRDAYSLEVAHNDFIKTLVEGVIANRDMLDVNIKPYLKNWKLERLGCCTRLILRMGLWELGKVDAVPSIVLNEAIELAKLFAEREAYKFVNGILDEVVKQASTGTQTEDK
ncbi:transcription antitermination factor NusB [Candidatus Dependentiae bacterium]|nr:transcription antitermination factor NusB [Candidatus Dependentiae bacterium]